MTYREFFSHVVEVVEALGAMILVVGLDRLYVAMESLAPPSRQSLGPVAVTVRLADSKDQAC